MMRQLIRQDELVSSLIIKNKTGIAAFHQTICRTLAKQDFAFNAETQGRMSQVCMQTHCQTQELQASGFYR